MIAHAWGIDAAAASPRLVHHCASNHVSGSRRRRNLAAAPLMRTLPARGGDDQERRVMGPERRTSRIPHFFERSSSCRPSSTLKEYKSWTCTSRRPTCVCPMTTLSADTNGHLKEGIKLATAEISPGVVSAGVVRGAYFWTCEQIVPQQDKHHLRDMNVLIENWDAVSTKFNAEAYSTDGIPLAGVKLLAPIPRPTGTIMCIGKNYLDHVNEVDKFASGQISVAKAPQYPIVFTKAPQSVIGPGAAIKYPHGASTQVDYEAELGVIIKTAGRGIKKEDAMKHIFGYTIINDVTARDLQKNHQQWFLGKSCDTFCPLGPWIIPASELDGRDLKVECWINDELRQSGRTSQMIFGIPELIEVISTAITIQPGDIIATGTPAGVGSGFNPPKHLKPGDIVRIDIEGIGS